MEALDILRPVLPQRPLYSPRQAAQLLGVKASTLRQWRERHQGPRHFEVSPRSILYCAWSVLAFGIGRILDSSNKPDKDNPK